MAVKMAALASSNESEMQCSQKLETCPGCEETQDKSIRTGPDSVVANEAALTREKKTKLTHPGERQL
ncbi:UNVERIFIED_CONTAM: hypothetical protein NCL1_18314 [Trichonephila clavipes]